MTFVLNHIMRAPTRLTWTHLRSGSMRTSQRIFAGMAERRMKLSATAREKDVARYL